MEDKYAGMNPYNYCFNNPAMEIDEDGEDPDPTGKSNNSSTVDISVIEAVKSEMDRHDADMQSLEKDITAAQSQIKEMTSYLNTHLGVVDIGMIWNPFFWGPQAASDVANGKSAVDWMAAQIGERATELENLYKQYNESYRGYKNAAASLKAIFENFDNIAVDGISFAKIDSETINASTSLATPLIGMAIGAAAKIHKNRSNAEGTYALYRIMIDNKIYKYGIADASRRTAAGVPVRLAQQISKLEKIFEGTGIPIGYKILDVSRTTKAGMLFIETGRIMDRAKKLGIPIGNVSHIKANVGKMIGEMTPRALEIMRTSKYFKYFKL